MNAKANFSKKVEAASEAVHDATKHLLAVMKAEYPKNCHVVVHHHRGSFHGTVSGWDTYGYRIRVRNDNSEKYAYWWYEQVERP